MPEELSRIRARRGTEKKFLSVEFSVSKNEFRKNDEAAKKAHDLLAAFVERHTGVLRKEIRDHQRSIKELGKALGKIHEVDGEKLDLRGMTFNAEGVGKGGEFEEAIQEFLKQKEWKIEPAKK